MNILTYNGQNIEQRIDGYVNATQMAKANDVRVNDWMRLEQTIAYIQDLEDNRTDGFNSQDIDE